MPAHPRSPTGLAALAFTQIVAWGVLYYAVLVAAPAIADDTGWGDDAVFVAITAGLLTSAACAIPVGRRLDRHPRRVMVTATVVGTVALLVAAASPTIWTFTAAWLVCGAAQSAVLYQAAFTVITHRYRAARRGPLTLVTLAGGLASTIFAPLTGWLVLQVGWRMSFLVLALILAAVALPTYALTVESRWEHVEDGPAGNGAARRVLRSMRFWMVASSFALMSFSLYAVTLSAVPATIQKGMDLQTAAWVLALIGAGQVLGRLLYLAIPHTAPAWMAATSVGVLGAGALVAYGVVDSPVAIFATALVAGAIRGALTLVQASAVADRWGAESYGRINGVLAAPVTALTALAPGAAALLATALGSYATMAFVMAAVCAVGGALVIRR
ncbi:MFS transporter [Microbacterium sp. QXD-8]|uniref:MFS transporter n=1 Tax=Microbacterium psychrotolerans TaxID=3068321 RepID=A0ABU0Z599_9MICO|nr:MFS transporter [Microbacterium sp. QXD-8]MDQ7879769.1 MFS transporter [Microbacterium sp. QXD-8]